MTFYNLATPFYTLGRHITPLAARALLKLQMQNMYFQYFFGSILIDCSWNICLLMFTYILLYFYNNLRHPQESYNNLDGTPTSKIASTKNILFSIFSMILCYIAVGINACLCLLNTFSYPSEVYNTLTALTPSKLWKQNMPLFLMLCNILKYCCWNHYHYCDCHYYYCYCCCCCYCYCCCYRVIVPSISIWRSYT